MARPVTLTEVIALVRKSGLLDDGVVKAFVAKIRQQGFRGMTPDGFLARMVEETLLTSFQAKQLSEGRWRGLVLGNYHLKTRIGRGGMGQVFLGEHRKLRRPVAIKVLNTNLADDPLAKARLVREASATAALDHPHIVKVFDIDAEHMPPYLVMEYVDGLSLQAVVALTGTLRIEAMALCGRQIASGLAHAAAAGLVHRDIKPANLLLDRLGVVKILDLGIVLLREDVSHLTVDLDGQPSILGTVDYLAPEQAVDSHNVDGRADIYALGGTLYFLLAGQPPFEEVSTSLRLLRKQSADPKPIHQLRPDVPEDLSAVIAKMLARNPADRYQTAQEAADALAPWATPIAGFPEDLFGQIVGADWSEEVRTKVKPNNPGQLQVNGSSVHAMLPPNLVPTDPGIELSPVSETRLIMTLSDRSLPTEVGPPFHKIVEKRAQTALVNRRRQYQIVAVVCSVVLILSFVLAWALGAFARPVGTTSARMGDDVLLRTK
jgi:eukaryotic-like serine/threonine-protein kinase